MQLTLRRFLDNGICTLGAIVSLKDIVCYTIERPYMNNEHDVSCIPGGVYVCVWEYSQRFDKFMYLVKDVPGREGIRIHSGNYVTESTGCIIPGARIIKAAGNHLVTDSRSTCEKLRNLCGDKFELQVLGV